MLTVFPMTIVAGSQEGRRLDRHFPMQLDQEWVVQAALNDAPSIDQWLE